MLGRPQRFTLLIVYQDYLGLDSFHLLFMDRDVSVVTAGSAEEALQLTRTHPPDVVLLGAQLPDMDALEAFQKIRDLAGPIPVIFVGDDSDPQAAIEAIKCGAFDYLVQPLAPLHVREVVANALQVSRSPTIPLGMPGEPDGDEKHLLLGRSPAMQEIYKALGRIAPQDINVLILGESGTGKEVVARTIHRHSRRSQGPFVAINCAAIPEGLLESELFGHEKGAFTGANRHRIGKFEQASGGTLLLDEIGDMSRLTQAKVLRVLQEQKFERVGGSELIRSDARVLAATNRDLQVMVAAGEFRLDLFYRLGVSTIALPPLRERGSDLPLLVEHFLRQFSRELGKSVSRTSPQTLGLLEQHTWPGNLRELQSVLKQALLRAQGSILLPDFLPSYLTGQPKPPISESRSSCLDSFIHRRITDGSTSLYADVQAETDRLVLQAVMRHTNGNQLRAAEMLGITRTRLRNKLRALGMPTSRSEWAVIDQFPKVN